MVSLLSITLMGVMVSTTALRLSGTFRSLVTSFNTVLTPSQTLSEEIHPKLPTTWKKLFPAICASWVIRKSSGFSCRNQLSFFPGNSVIRENMFLLCTFPNAEKNIANYTSSLKESTEILEPQLTRFTAGLFFYQKSKVIMIALFGSIYSVVFQVALVVATRKLLVSPRKLFLLYPKLPLGKFSTVMGTASPCVPFGS